MIVVSLLSNQIDFIPKSLESLANFMPAGLEVPVIFWRLTSQKCHERFFGLDRHHFTGTFWTSTESFELITPPKSRPSANSDKIDFLFKNLWTSENKWQ